MDVCRPWGGCNGDPRSYTRSYLLSDYIRKSSDCFLGTCFKSNWWNELVCWCYWSVIAALFQGSNFLPNITRFLEFYFAFFFLSIMCSIEDFIKIYPKKKKKKISSKLFSIEDKYQILLFISQWALAQSLKWYLPCKSKVESEVMGSRPINCV